MQLAFFDSPCSCISSRL